MYTTILKNLDRGRSRVAHEDKQSTSFDDPPLDYAYPCFVVKIYYQHSWSYIYHLKAPSKIFSPSIM